MRQIDKLMATNKWSGKSTHTNRHNLSKTDIDDDDDDDAADDNADEDVDDDNGRSSLTKRTGRFHFWRLKTPMFTV